MGLVVWILGNEIPVAAEDLYARLARISGELVEMAQGGGDRELSLRAPHIVLIGDDRATTLRVYDSGISAATDLTPAGCIALAADLIAAAAWRLA